MISCVAPEAPSRVVNGCAHAGGTGPTVTTAATATLLLARQDPPSAPGCLSVKRSDTVGEITTRRQKPLVLRIMVEQGRIIILFLSGLTPRCEQIFPHRCCFQPVRRFRQQCPTVWRPSPICPATPCLTTAKRTR